MSDIEFPSDFQNLLKNVAEHQNNQFRLCKTLVAGFTLLVTLRAFWGDCYNSELQIDYLLEKEPMVREAFILAS